VSVVVCCACKRASQTDFTYIAGKGMPDSGALLIHAGGTDGPRWLCAGCIRLANTAAGEYARALLEEEGQ
jgi:hypothetical protein